MTTAAAQRQVLTRPAAYGLLGAATIGAIGLVLAAPEALAAAGGSLGTGTAVFVSPVWRFISKLNDLYVDTAMFVSADREKFANRFSKQRRTVAQEALAKHKPRFNRALSYLALGATAVTTATLAVIAPTALATAFGSIAVSGASFTKPVIDLVEKVNHSYRDIYGYLRRDIFRFLPKLPELIPVEETTELDKSIYAPVDAPEKPLSRLQTYAILGAAAVGATVLFMAAPSVLLAAAGTILGSAVSYTAPILNFVKKLNKVYDKTEDQITEGITHDDDHEVLKRPAQKASFEKEGVTMHISKPVAWMLGAAAIAGLGIVAVHAPTFVMAAIGGVLGSASSFTTPVLKGVGRVNHFYLTASDYLKQDRQRILSRLPGYKPAPEEKHIPAPEVSPSDLGQVDLKKAFSEKATPNQPVQVAEPAARKSGHRPTR